MQLFSDYPQTYPQIFVDIRGSVCRASFAHRRCCRCGACKRGFDAAQKLAAGQGFG